MYPETAAFSRSDRSRRSDPEQNSVILVPF